MRFLQTWIDNTFAIFYFYKLNIKFLLIPLFYEQNTFKKYRAEIYWLLTDRCRSIRTLTLKYKFIYKWPLTIDLFSIFVFTKTVCDRYKKLLGDYLHLAILIKVGWGLRNFVKECWTYCEKWSHLCLKKLRLYCTMYICDHSFNQCSISTFN